MFKSTLHAYGMGWVHSDSLRHAKQTQAAQRANLAILDLETIDLYALLLLEELQDRPIALIEPTLRGQDFLSHNITVFERPVSELLLRDWCRRKSVIAHPSYDRYAV